MKRHELLQVLKKFHEDWPIFLDQRSLNCYSTTSHQGEMNIHDSAPISWGTGVKPTWIFIWQCWPIASHITSLHIFKAACILYYFHSCLSSPHPSHSYILLLLPQTQKNNKRVVTTLMIPPWPGVKFTLKLTYTNETVPMVLSFATKSHDYVECKRFYSCLRTLQELSPLLQVLLALWSFQCLSACSFGFSLQVYSHHQYY